jgi:hypothetical protein
VAATLSGCFFFPDTPTEFTQATPIHVAGDGDVLVFKAPSESDQCPLDGGEESLVAVTDAKNESSPLRFAYQRSKDTPRNDVLALTTAAGTLSVSGQGQYSLAAPGAPPSWQPLTALSAEGRELRSKTGATLLVASSLPGHARIEATRNGRDALFTGTVIPHEGFIYVRHGVFTPLVASYTGDSQHNCGSWDNPKDATIAVNEIEGHIPP